METPLLVPSFSSIVDRKIGQIHTNLRDLIPAASLVSAYDLSYKYLNKNAIWVSDVVFVDSGNYELDKLADSIRREFGKTDFVSKKIWSAQMYSSLIDKIKPLSRVVLVNFDERELFQTQISDAKSLFSNYPDYAKCFLYRPPSKSANYIDMPTLVENVTSLESFDILGVTEKELGGSLLKRCENLLLIRQELFSNQLDIPIHVFGCLDPLGILIFFLCGADIFDGTSWLKFSFHNNLALYTNNCAILSQSWSDTDLSIRESTYILNLSRLTHLMNEMKRFTQKYDFSVFGLDDNVLKEIKNIIATAKVKHG
jgi:hypothetical protein